MKNSVIALSLLIAATAHAAAPTVEEVGDADSFGRDVVYLGNAQTANVALQADCTPDPMAPPPPPNDRCVVLNAQPATTTFLEDGLATMQLPADSTKSLICFALTPNVFFEFSNQTGAHSAPRARCGSSTSRTTSTASACTATAKTTSSAA